MGIVEALETPAAENSSRLVRELAEEVMEHAGSMVKRYSRPAAGTPNEDEKKGVTR